MNQDDTPKGVMQKRGGVVFWTGTHPNVWRGEEIVDLIEVKKRHTPLFQKAFEGRSAGTLKKYSSNSLDYPLLYFKT